MQCYQNISIRKVCSISLFYSDQFSDAQTNNYLNVVLFSCVLPKHSQSTRCTTAEQSNVLSQTKVKSLYIVTVHTNPATIAKSTCQNGCKKCNYFIRTFKFIVPNYRIEFTIYAATSLHVWTSSKHPNVSFFHPSDMFVPLIFSITSKIDLDI